MMDRVAHELIRLVFCAALAAALTACVDAVDLRAQSADKGLSLGPDASPSDAQPADAPPAEDMDAASNPGTTDDSGAPDAATPAADAAEPAPDSGSPEAHPDAAPVEHPDSGTMSPHGDGGTPDDAAVNACEVAGYECLDSLTYGGVCPSPRVSEHFACTRLADRDRICCSRL